MQYRLEASEHGGGNRIPFDAKCEEAVVFIMTCFNFFAAMNRVCALAQGLNFDSCSNLSRPTSRRYSCSYSLSKNISCTLGRLARWDRDGVQLKSLEKIIETESNVKQQKFGPLELKQLIRWHKWKKVSEITAHANDDSRLHDWIVEMGSRYEKEANFLLKFELQLSQRQPTLLELICEPAYDADQRASKQTTKRQKTAAGEPAPGAPSASCNCSCGFEQCWRKIVELQGTHTPDALLEALIEWARKGRIRGNWIFVTGVGGSGKSYCITDAIAKLMGADYTFITPASMKGAYPQEPLG